MCLESLKKTRNRESVQKNDEVFKSGHKWTDIITTLQFWSFLIYLFLYIRLHLSWIQRSGCPTLSSALMDGVAVWNELRRCSLPFFFFLIFAAGKQSRKENMHPFASSYSHIVLAGAAPPGPRQQLAAHQTKVQAERKEISRHKSSLCNAVKLHWFYVFFSFPFDRQHEIVASCHVKQEFRDCSGSSSITEFFGRNVSLAAFCIEASSICYLFVVVAFKQ